MSWHLAPWTRFVHLLLAGALAVAGCGGGGTSRPDASADADEAGWPDAGFDPGPPPEPPPRMAAPRRPVTVRIDRIGVRHIEAEDATDLFFAAGYQMAADRLAQMDLMRRRAMGRQAEVLGEEKLGEDRLIRWLDVPRLGRLDLHRLEREAPEVHALLLAWTAGVNRFVDEVLSGARPLPYGFGPGELRYQPEPWRASEVLSIVKLILFANQNQLEKELLASVLRRQAPEVEDSGFLIAPHFDVFTVPPEDRPTRGPSPRPSPAPSHSRSTVVEGISMVHVAESLAALHRAARVFDFGGSNNWAVAARATANGRPLLAGDPHTTLSSPSLLVVQHLRSRDGTYDVAGFSFVGSPMVHFGHNRRVAWSLTNAFPDTMDLWHLGLEEEGRYVSGATGRYAVYPRVERIRVRAFDASGRPLDSWREEEVRFREVPALDGVLVEPFVLPPALYAPPGRVVLFRWVGRTATNESPVFLQMNQATSLDAFLSALEPAMLLGFGIMAADASEIGFRVAAKVPDRGGPGDRGAAWRLLDGSDPKTWWSGSHLPLDRMPHARNPSRGFLLTANNDHFGFTADGRLDDDPWYYGALFAPGYRAHRIESELARLTARGGVTPEDMEALQIDVHSTLADELLPALEAAWEATSSDPTLSPFAGRADLAALVNLLRAWDRSMSMDRREPVAFHAWMQFLTARVLGDEFSFLFDQVLGSAGPFLVKIAVLPLLRGGTEADTLLDGSPPKQILLQALADTADWLQSRFGAVSIDALPTWGTFHGFLLEGPFPGSRQAVGFVGASGGLETVSPAELSRFFDGGGIAERLFSRKGAIFRMVVSFRADGTPRARVSWPGGNSADPDAPHFRDRLQDWVQGRYVELPFEEDEVTAATERTLTIAPPSP